MRLTVTAARRKTTDMIKQYMRKACHLSTWRRFFKGEIDTAGVRRTIQAAGGESSEERKLKDSRRDIMNAFGETSQPCLFIYGGNDPEADDAWDCYGAFCTARNIPHARHVIDGANHNFYSQVWSVELERKSGGSEWGLFPRGLGEADPGVRRARTEATVQCWADVAGAAHSSGQQPERVSRARWRHGYKHVPDNAGCLSRDRTDARP